jgi:DNA helicase IV
MKYGSNLNSNPFYSPQLVTIIINYLYVMPMWSGVMLHKRTSHLVNYKSKKRTTNNPVESHFDFDKNKLLHKKRFVKPSEFIAPKYRFLLSKFIQNYLTEINQEKKIKKQITDELEMWKNKKQFNRIKGFYYQNIAYFEKDQEIGSNYQSYQNDTSNKFKHEAPDQLQVVNDVEINPNRILKGNLVSFQN